MHLMLYIVSGFFFLTGVAVVAMAKSVFHESLALNIFICSTVLFSGAAIVQAVNRLADRFEED